MPFDAIPEDRIPLGAARMIQLANFLEGLNPEQYNHNCWGWEKLECGTVACAMGWAGLSRMFDFEYVFNRNGDGNFFKDGKPVFSAIDLASSVFEISADEAMYLFGNTYFSQHLPTLPNLISTRPQVIEALRAIAANKIEQAKAHSPETVT